MPNSTTVLYPADLAQLPDGSVLFGYAHADTHQMVVIGGERQAINQPQAMALGWLESLDSDDDDNTTRGSGPLVALRDGQTLSFLNQGQPANAQPYDLRSTLFSRHAGLLEAPLMQQAGVIVCGCGSVGGLAALELARSGVGRFLLIDPDLLAIENLCRHPCGLSDVGRRKVEAIAERIYQINPGASVETHATRIEALNPALVQAFVGGGNSSEARDQVPPPTLMLACADSRRADRQAARLASALGLPFLAIGLWERAFAGEIFYSHPGEPMPCYGCAFEPMLQQLGGELSDGDSPGASVQSQLPTSGRANHQRRFYTTEAELETLDFQPGLGLDIAHVTQIGLKLALDLLNLHTPSYIPRLLGKISQFTLVCNSNDPRLGGERAEIFSHPLQVTTSIQVSHGQGCPPCRWVG